MAAGPRGHRPAPTPPTPYLLQVTQDVGPAVEDALALGGVQVVQKLRGVVLVTLLIPGERNQGPGLGGSWLRPPLMPSPGARPQALGTPTAPQSPRPPRSFPKPQPWLGQTVPCQGQGHWASPKHQAPLDLRLHLLSHVLHVGLRGEGHGEAGQGSGQHCPPHPAEGRLPREDHSRLTGRQGRYDPGGRGLAGGSRGGSWTMRPWKPQGGRRVGGCRRRGAGVMGQVPSQAGSPQPAWPSPVLGRFSRVLAGDPRGL